MMLEFISSDSLIETTNDGEESIYLLEAILPMVSISSAIKFLVSHFGFSFSNLDPSIHFLGN